MAIVLCAWFVAAWPTLGADPSSLPPSAAAPGSIAPLPSAGASPGILGTGDPRSNGQGPGLVGSPLAILIAVMLLGAGTSTGTLLYLRVTRKR